MSINDQIKPSINGLGAAKFEYDNALSGTEIRLLKLSSGQPDETDSLKLSVEVHKLAEAPAYHALSYTWGPPSEGYTDYTSADLKSIHIDDREFKVYPNLFDALQHIAKYNCAEYYWIDAICINQTNKKEQGEQVMMMDSIYRSAQRVDVWLGPVESNVDELFQLLDTLEALDRRERNLRASDNGHHELRLKADFHIDESLESLGLPSFDDSLWASLLQVLSRRWFSRLWIVQEVALAKDAVILWRDRNVNWQTVLSSALFLWNTDLAQILIAKNMADPLLSPNSGVHMIRLVATTSLCDLNSKDLGTFCQSLSRIYTGSSTGSDLLAHVTLYLLVKARNSGVADRRDKVYALLGMINHLANILGCAKSPIVPDYGAGSCPATVFTDVTREIITGGRNLHILCLVTSKNDRQVKDLPSWVLDLAASTSNSIIHESYDRTYIHRNPSRTLTLDDPQFRIHGRNLHITGHCVGTVADLGEPLVTTVENGCFEQTARLLSQCQQASPWTGQDSIEVYWRTLILDWDGSSSPAGPEIGIAFRHWLRVVLGSWPVQRGMEHVHGELEKMAFLDDLVKNDLTNTIPDRASLLELIEIWPKIKTGTLAASSEDSRSAMDACYSGYQTYHQLSRTIVDSRRVFLTKEGHMGIGLESIELGDLVYVVPGCSSLLVMRKVDVGEDVALEVGEQVVELISEAYVHGIMYGEAVDENTKWEKICLV